MNRTLIPAAVITLTLLAPAAAVADPVPVRPGVWWMVPSTAQIIAGQYPRPTRWTLNGVDYGVADNGHLYGDGVDLGVPCPPFLLPAPVADHRVTRLQARNKALRHKVAKLRVLLRQARR